MTEKIRVGFELNGEPVEVWAWAHQTLLEVLRDALGATEVKYGCGEGVCGTCAVLLDGQTVNACLLMAPQVEAHRITTVRGLELEGQMHALQVAFVQHGASQCGFCTPGMLLAAHEFIEDNPEADRSQIRYALAGNLCRCTGYTKIIDAVEAYASGRDRRRSSASWDGENDE